MILRSWWNVLQKVAIATHCVLCDPIHTTSYTISSLPTAPLENYTKRTWNMEVTYCIFISGLWRGCKAESLTFRQEKKQRWLPKKLHFSTLSYIIQLLYRPLVSNQTRGLARPRNPPTLCCILRLKAHPFRGCASLPHHGRFIPALQ